MEKKKRGRKPKSNIVLNENPVFDKNNNDNLISCIKHPKDININEINGCENNINLENDNMNFETENNICFLKNIDISEGTKKCWNCCHDINSDIISYPIKYINKIFYTNGNFCSY